MTKARDFCGLVVPVRPISVVHLPVTVRAAFKAQRALMSASILVTADNVSRKVLLDGHDIYEKALADLCDH
jgi:hypothetical protein